MTSYPEQRKPAVKKDLSQERLLLQGRRLMTRHVLNTPYTNFRPYASAFSMTFQAYTKLFSVKISRLTCRKPDLSIERFTGLVYVCFQHFRLGVALYLACCNVKPNVPLYLSEYSNHGYFAAAQSHDFGLGNKIICR